MTETMKRLTLIWYGAQDPRTKLLMEDGTNIFDLFEVDGLSFSYDGYGEDPGPTVTLKVYADFILEAQDAIRLVFQELPPLSTPTQQGRPGEAER